ncbi:MAG: hypothetical protein WBD28_00385 [Candidatus Zixiibacteriota bacterium]
MRTKEVSTKFEKFFNYSVCAIISILGFLVLLNAFNIDPRFRIIFGWLILGYGILRFLLMWFKYRNEK